MERKICNRCKIEKNLKIFKAKTQIVKFAIVLEV